MKRIVGFIAALVLLLGVGTACGYNSDYEKRQEQEKIDAQRDTLEKKNLRAKIKLEEDPNRVGYLYLISFGKPFGYYVIKGKVSSSGSQLGPQDQLLNPCASSACHQVVDGPQDDGTYGDGDPGVFFFTAEGVFVETQLDTVYSTAPIPSSMDIPKLG